MDFTPLVLVSPVTEDAIKALAAAVNRGSVINGTPYFNPPAPTHVCRIDFGVLFGRHCIDFGSSRANIIVLPPAADVASRQFHICVNPENLETTLASTLLDGRPAVVMPGRKRDHLTSEPRAFGDDIILYFGEADRYGFQVNVLAQTVDLTFVKNLHRYAISIGNPGRTTPESHGQSVPLQWRFLRPSQAKKRAREVLEPKAIGQSSSKQRQ